MYHFSGRVMRIVHLRIRVWWLKVSAAKRLIISTQQASTGSANFAWIWIRNRGTNWIRILLEKNTGMKCMIYGIRIQHQYRTAYFENLWIERGPCSRKLYPNCCVPGSGTWMGSLTCWWTGSSHRLSSCTCRTSGTAHSLVPLLGTAC